MKQNYLKKTSLTFLFFVLSVFVATAQIYIAEGGVLSYNGGIFKLGIIDNTHGGVFAVSTNYTPNDHSYVMGKVTFLKPRNYSISLEKNFEKRNPTFDVEAEGATVAYSAKEKPLGTPPNEDYVLASAEVYKFTGSISGGTAKPLSTSFDDSDSNTSQIVVYKKGGVWMLKPEDGITEMSFAEKKSSTLSTDLFDKEHFSMYPNPLSANESNIHFTLPSTIRNLNVDVYDVTGKLVKNYKDIAVQAGENMLMNPSLTQGIYLLRFTFNKGEQIMTKRLIVK